MVRLKYTQFWLILHDVRISKQNRSTEGRSKLSPKTWHGQEKMVLTLGTNASPKWDRTRCPEAEGVSVLCWPVAPVAMFYGNLAKFGNKVKIATEVKFGNKFTNWWNVWSIEGVTVYGHVQECHVTFGRGRPPYVWWDPHIDHKTSWGTISNFPWHIPVRGA